MLHTRRSFLQGSLAAAGIAALRPAGAFAAGEERFGGFALAAAGRLTPRPSSAIAASSLSVGYETLDRRHFDAAKTYQHAARLGVKWARCQTGWARCEPARGRYEFKWLDDVVNGLLKIGIQPWFNLGYGNPLYMPQADATAVGWVPVFDEQAVQGWMAFTAKIAEHFRDRVRHWEIWNEPNITGFWKPGKPDAAAYARLIAQTAPILRQHVHESVIIGGALAGVPLDYFKKCLQAGLAGHVDKISYHPYRSRPESHYESDVAALRELLKKHGAARVGLWQGENGCPSQKGGAGALHEVDWNESRQAKWLLRRIVGDLRLEIELTSYFLIVDLVGYRGSTNWKGLLRGTDYTPKPAYSAYQNVCALFDCDTRRTKETIEVEGAGDAGVLTASFLRRNQPLWAYWTPAELTRDVPLGKVRLKLDGKQAPPSKPALLDPLTGQVYRVAAWDNLPLADYPLLISDESILT